MAPLKTPSVPALERAISIMELLANSRIGLPLAGLARQMNLPKSSVHCLLLTLERHGYLYRNTRTKRYLFGSRLFTLANVALGGMELRERAAPILQDVARKTGLTIHLAILEQNEAVLIEKVEPLGTPKLATWLGKRMEVHCTGIGKALIAFLPEPEIDRLIRDHGLPRHNDNTIVSPQRLKSELARVRELGFSIDDEEDEIGFRCIGAPVFDAGGQIAAAISMSGMVSRITRENSPALAEELRRAARELSQSLSR